MNDPRNASTEALKRYVDRSYRVGESVTTDRNEASSIARQWDLDIHVMDIDGVPLGEEWRPRGLGWERIR